MADDQQRDGRLVKLADRMPTEYLRRRTAMFQNFRMEGYWKIGTGDPKNVQRPKRKTKKP